MTFEDAFWSYFLFILEHMGKHSHLRQSAALRQGLTDTWWWWAGPKAAIRKPFSFAQTVEDNSVGYKKHF